MRVLPMVLAVAGVTAAVAMAPAATAAPNCVNTGPMTTQCQTPGHAQIITSPPAMNNGPWYGWPFGGGFVLDLGW
ncbi:MAG: hypothetical protein QOI28_32 [Mycobacterium sp.]|jgi:hypothetical protein|nr:hypothetical protein [Mycobacterium sp.]MDT5263799.1 hypothetical protein [Mycobacterium sp.]MDT5358309.1 hypothetical protein [Mycobacterium sp.]